MWQLLAAGINNRGTWSASSSYDVNDAVTDQGAFWLATAPTSANTANPNTSCEPGTAGCAGNWQQLAAQGASGQAGAQGPAGALKDHKVLQGPAGPPGQRDGGPQRSPGAGGGGFNGIQGFTPSGTLTVPAGVTHLLVEMWVPAVAVVEAAREIVTSAESLTASISR